jgi:hypothetical protein
MFLVVKKIKCTGMNFSVPSDFLAWHAAKNTEIFKDWLGVKQSAGDMVYTTSTIIDPERVENVYLFQDQLALDAYNAMLAAEPMASAIAALEASGELIVESTTVEVV